MPGAESLLSADGGDVPTEESKALVVRVTQEIVQELTNQGGKIMGSSVDLAKRFGKYHYNVLQTIQTIECTNEFREFNFKLSEYAVPGQRRSYPMYLLTRDGTTFLAMRLGGKDSDLFTESYIKAFNWMEDKLFGQDAALPSSFDRLEQKVQMQQQILNRLVPGL